MAVEVTSLVWQLVEATAQLIKLIKSVTSLVLKKRKASTIICVFYEKRRLKWMTEIHPIPHNQLHETTTTSAQKYEEF